MNKEKMKKLLMNIIALLTFSQVIHAQVHPNEILPVQGDSACEWSYVRGVREGGLCSGKDRSYDPAAGGFQQSDVICHS